MKKTNTTNSLPLPPPPPPPRRSGRSSSGSNSNTTVRPDVGKDGIGSTTNGSSDNDDARISSMELFQYHGRSFNNSKETGDASVGMVASATQQQQQQQQQQQSSPHSIAVTELPRLESAPTSGVQLLSTTGYEELFQSANEQFHTAASRISAGFDLLTQEYTTISSTNSISGPFQQQQQQQHLIPPPPPTTMTTSQSSQPKTPIIFQPTVAPVPPLLPMLSKPSDHFTSVGDRNNTSDISLSTLPPPHPTSAATTTPTTTTTMTTTLPRPISKTFFFRKTTTMPQHAAHQHQQQQQLPVTAIRQECITVLVIATESAHQLAWKNQLQLTDLIQGFVKTAIGCNSSSTDTIPIQPFRSVSRIITIPWDQINLQFVSGEEYNLSSSSSSTTSTTTTSSSSSSTPSMSYPDDTYAATILQQSAILQPQDGNLAQELDLLEDQVDNLLPSYTHHEYSKQDSNQIEDGMNYSYNNTEQRQKIQEQVYKDAYQLTSPMHIPWLRRYRLAMDEGTNLLPHEAFHCPAIILSVCTTQEEINPLETLRALQGNLHYLPIQFRNGLWDISCIRNEVLVLHDNVSGPQNWDESVLRQQLIQSFGAASTVLRLNSLDVAIAAIRATEEESDLWGGSGQLGNCLTAADRARVRKYLANLVASAIVPALERRVADLNAIVNDRKKGVKNVLKNLWGVRRKEEDENGTGIGTNTNKTYGDAVIYRYDSIESQTRLLADTLFLLRDYDAACSMYRLIKDDFKQDKNWIHYASVHEMIALSLYMSDRYGRSKEIFSSIENALLSYSRAADEATAAAGNKWGEKVTGRITAAPVPTRLATRLCLVLTLMKNICADRHLEVADLLASASSHETSLGAAVLLEQSSAHYYHAEMYRKYAFHMLMSGHMFRSAEQEHHAFRCFTSALHIYRDGRWEELHNHLRSALAAQLFSMGRMAIALQLYAKLVGSAEGGRVSLKSQQKFVKALLEICNDHPKKALVGADRMAAPAQLSGAERDAFRKDRLDRVVQVVRYTKSASRVLELPNMDLPRVDDSTVTVLAEEASHHRHTLSSFGQEGTGSPEVWNDLALRVMAEMRALDTSLTLGDTIMVNKALNVIEDVEIRRVVALMETEKANRAKEERMKRSETYKDKAPVRALKEPISVEFSLGNPLGIPIDLCSLQLVARMKSENAETMCTNEGAVSIRPLVAANEKPCWTFQSSDVEFSIADFCRVSAGKGDTEKGSWKSAEDVEPFFVVTKSNHTLEPESVKTVSASICPLVLGNLEIVGVRCRLVDDVWVYHPFNIKGPLLQNTRSNRANRVRGESFLLKSNVKRGMPCLTVDLVECSSNSIETVLQSQVVSYSLRVSNVGTAAAANLLLKTNLPWLRILALQPELIDEMSSTSNCMGPTGTLMLVPLKGESLQSDGFLQPGEIVNIPIEIKTTGVGKQDFYMIFRYELHEGSTNMTPRFRWLKKMFVVPVYPSITMSASALPAFSAKGQHTLSVEFTNCRTDRPDNLEINLTELAVASRRYRLELLPGQTNSSSAVSIGWQERATFHYQLVNKEADSSVLAHCPFSASENKALNLLDFLCLEQAHENFENALEQHQMALARAAASGDDGHQPRSIASIRRANTVDMSQSAHASKGKVDGHWTSIARLCPSDDSGGSIHIICSWNGSYPSSFWGSHHIRKVPIRPPSSVASKECPITLTASHPSIVTNDFRAGPAHVPLRITMINRVDTPLNVEFAIVTPNTFDFTGPDNYKTKLGGGEELSIPMKAQLPSAGVYNLQRVLLTVDNGQTASYRFPLQWMVTANDAM